MRKTKRNRTPKDKRTTGIQVKFVEVKTKSQAGVEYVHYTPVFPPGPQGLNHIAKRRLAGWNKKHAKK